jgi:tetratricopeptide (TPR) repeat protein
LEFQRAIALDPNYATACFWYALLLSPLGRSDEALSQIQKAREIDPFSAIIQANSVRIFVLARRFDRAIEEGRKAARDNPNFAPVHNFLGNAYEASGMSHEAGAEYRRAADLIGQAPQGLWLRGRAEALEGKRAEALATIDELKAMTARRYVSPSYNAAIFIRLGEKDHAFEWLARACDDPLLRNRSFRRSARAGWARCTERGKRGSGARLTSVLHVAQ